MMRHRVLVSWSSGKDSAWMLHTLRQRDDVDIVGLVTTVNATFGRVAMHGVRNELVQAQADAAGIPWWPIPLPWPCSNAEYEAIMGGVIERAVAESVTRFAFGDLFLEDIRAYRERQLAGTGIEPWFPIWGTREQMPQLAETMLAAGFRATLTCVDPKQLSPSFVGREWNADLLAALPPSVDRCGENGEFHTFCHTGPMFAHPIRVQPGEIVERDGFWFADLLPLAAENWPSDNAGGGV